MDALTGKVDSGMLPTNPILREGLDENALKLKLEALRKLGPYMKLVERERQRVRFDNNEG